MDSSFLKAVLEGMSNESTKTYWRD